MATVRIQLRRGTSGQWDSANPILAAGEIGIETDTNTFKFGDGTTAWNDLDYALSDTVDDYIPLSLKGAANGVAELDGSGKVPYSQIPSIDELSQDAVNEALVAGTGITKTYNDGANTITVAVDTSVIATKAELAEVSQDSINDALVAGEGLNKTYDDVNNLITIDIDSTVATLTGTQTLTNKTLTSPVINTPTGIVKADVGLENVDNTSDVNKPVSTAQAAADATVASNAATALSNHEADTTNVHGITNTAELATQTYANNAASAAQSNAETYADGLITNLVGGAPAVLNTLNELATALGDDNNFANTIANQLSYKAPLESPTFTGTVNLPSTTSIGSVSDTELGYLNGVTSGIQVQISSKSPSDSPTFTGTVTLPEATSIGNVTNVELSYISGVTSSIQGQIDAKLNSTDAASIYATNASPTFTGTVTLPGSTNIGSVSDTELGYLNGVTSSVQGQIDSKLNSTDAASTYAPIASPTFTGTVTLPGSTNIGSVSDIELGYLNGVTSSVQGQIDSKLNSTDAASTYAPIASPTFTGTVTLPGSTDIGSVSSTELGYLNGVTSAVQTQIDAKAPSASPTFTGTVILPDGTVTGTMIADTTVPTSKIADTAITAAKLASSAVETAKINDLAVTTEKLADSSVTSGKIADGTIVNGDINASAAIDWTKLAISSTVSATELGYVDGVTSAIQTQIDAKLASATAASTYAPIASPTFTGTVSGITKSMVNLGNVDNTSDANKPVSTATQTALDAKLALAGGTMTGALTLSGAPSSDLHAATKAYVDNVSAGINFHQPVRVATTENITLSGTQTIDGVAVIAGDRVLVKDQTDQKTNGIYVVASGSWTRATDADNTPSGELAGGDFSLVLEGTVNSGYGYVCSNTSAITIGSTNITYAAFNAAKAVSAGTGLTETTPGTLAVDTSTIQARVSGVSDTEIGYLDGVTSAIQTQIDSKAPIASPTFTGTVTVAASGVAFTDGTQTKEGVPSRTTVDSKTADYTLVLTDRDKMIEVNSSSALTVSIPTDASVNFPVGTSIDLLRVGSGSVTISAATPATTTLNYTPGNKLRAQWSSATLFKRAANTWVLMGDLTA